VSDTFLSAFSGFGIEIEYMIVDRTTLAVAPVADRLLTAAEGELTNETEQGATCWSNELVLHVIELKTNGPRDALDSIAPDFQSDIVRINGMLAPLGACLLPGGAHPWMVPARDTHVWPHDDDAIYAAYDRIFGCQGHGWSNLQSMHINLPFKDDAEFGPLHAAIRAVLPLLPALAASTPILEGQRTGFADARVDAYARNQIRVPPITGVIIPPPVRSGAEYQSRILAPMYRAIAPHDPKSILQYEWLNSHGAIARFDRQTIEIRLLDTQEQSGADLAIAALVVAVVKRLYEGRAENLAAADALDTQLLADLLLRCVKDGEDARIDAPEYLRVLGVSPVTQSAGTVWRKLAKLAQDELKVHQGPLDVILGEGTLATRLLRSIGPTCDRDALLRTYTRLRDCLAAGRMFHAGE
jgi:carboxylate-amine ligase